MSINWKPIETAPQDRPIYLWEYRGGACKVVWRQDPGFRVTDGGLLPLGTGYWADLAIRNDGSLFQRLSINEFQYLAWCEVGELEPPEEVKNPLCQKKALRQLGSFKEVGS
jgi:hypothetical protein